MYNKSHLHALLLVVLASNPLTAAEEICIKNGQAVSFLFKNSIERRTAKTRKSLLPRASGVSYSTGSIISVINMASPNEKNRYSSTTASR